MEIDSVDEEMLTKDPDTIMSMKFQTEREKARIYKKDMDEDDFLSDSSYSVDELEDPEHTPEKGPNEVDAGEVDANEESSESEPLEYDSQYESDSENGKADTIEGDDACEVPNHDDLAISLQVESMDTRDASEHKVLVTSLQKGKKEEASAVSHPKPALFTALHMYVLARKYQVRDLCLLAQERFMRSADMYWIKQDYRARVIEDVEQKPRSHWKPSEPNQDKLWKTEWTNADGFVDVIDDLFTYTGPEDPLRRYICNLISHDFSMQADIREKLRPLIQKHKDFAVRMLDSMVCYAGLNEQATQAHVEEAARQLRREPEKFKERFLGIKKSLDQTTNMLDRTINDLEEYRTKIRHNRDIVTLAYYPSF